MTYAGTLQANANAPSYTSTHAAIGYKVAVNGNLPAGTGNTSFQVSDSNGTVHNMSVNGATITDVVTMNQDGRWTITVTTWDGLNWKVSYSNTVPQSGTFTFQLPSDAVHEHIGEFELGALAYCAFSLSDGLDKPKQVALIPCCRCMNDSMLVAFLASGALAAFAILAGPEILGLGVAASIFGLGSAYLGGAGATLGWMYNRYHC